MAKVIESMATSGKVSAFPFWLRKYPTDTNMLNCPNNIPRETFEGYPSVLKRAFSRANEHADETRILNNRPYFLKYRRHTTDTGSLPMQVVGLVGHLKTFENHLTKIDDKYMKKEHMNKRNVLNRQLQKLRVEDFPSYWRLMQDFQLWGEVRQKHQGMIDLGAFMQSGPDAKSKTAFVESYVDPEMLYGCEETGESRFAVSKRLGKIYQAGLQVYVKDAQDGLWKLAEIIKSNPESKTCEVVLLAVNDIIPNQHWDDIKPFDLYSTSRAMAAEDPIRGEEAEAKSRETYFENLKQTDPTRYEQEWYQHICNKYYDGKAPTGSFRGWRQRFMLWDPQTTSKKRVRWVKGLSKYMQRRVYLGYPVRHEVFSRGKDGKEEPWWVQSLPVGAKIK
eukprot:TRINITY_DN13355_c0_g1_i2.p1 TRINITY_DN13355_c0_g1~~TRINITY_DN13355_c0_g1_i2.p1  ORF type:complete len:411 (+),score=78.11 TRINITY_DN13355_c0_g1_i2:62-1234(+)